MKRVQLSQKEFIDRIKANPIKVYANEFTTGEENIPSQLSEMKREVQEKKLLEYQINTKKGNINQFLLNKYSDGNFNVAEVDGYDNSKNRIENGISYEYHVYFPKQSQFNESRPHNHYYVSPEIINHKTGDSYFYHIPLHINNSNQAITVLATDTDNEIISKEGVSVSNDGLVFALKELSLLIKNNGVGNLSAMTISILKRHGLIMDNKIKYDIVNNLLVEKYLKNINNKTKHNALVYLNQYFTSADEKKSVEQYEKDTDTLPLSEKQLENRLNNLEKQLDKIIYDETVGKKILESDKEKLIVIKNKDLEMFKNNKKEFANEKELVEKFKNGLIESIETFENNYNSEEAKKERLIQEEKERLAELEKEKLAEEDRQNKLVELEKKLQKEELQDDFKKFKKELKPELKKIRDLGVKNEIDITEFNDDVNDITYETENYKQKLTDLIKKYNDDYNKIIEEYELSEKNKLILEQEKIINENISKLGKYEIIYELPTKEYVNIDDVINVKIDCREKRAEGKEPPFTDNALYVVVKNNIGIKKLSINITGYSKFNKVSKIELQKLISKANLESGINDSGRVLSEKNTNITSSDETKKMINIIKLYDKTTPNLDKFLTEIGIKDYKEYLDKHPELKEKILSKK